jgi:HAD domain in Swiss Army Knife RNA repair proteins
VTILFLDFDGVLHPYSPWPHDEAVRSQYFIHLPRLERVLRDFAEVRIVIASDWRLYHSLEKLRSFFSQDIRSRVSGTTALERPTSEGVGQRQLQAEQYLREHKLVDVQWVAVDDTPTNYLPDARVVLCEDRFGTREETELRQLLKESRSTLGSRPLPLRFSNPMSNVHDIPASSPYASGLGDPVAPLTASELGRALGGLGEEVVQQRERAGKVFSIYRPTRERGREYPAFQSWPTIAGEPLERVLAALGRVSGADAYGFFTSPTDLLAGLTPIEALLGHQLSPRSLESGADKLLASASTERLGAVEKAAIAIAAQLSA